MVNRAATDHFGWTQEEFLSKNIKMIMPPEIAEKHDMHMLRYMHTKETKVIGRRREMTAVRKDGTELPIELAVSKVNTLWGETFFCGFVSDIRRRKYDEIELKEKEKLMHGLTGAAMDPTFAVDEHRTIYLANSCAASVLGWDQKEFVGKDLNMFMAEKKKKAQQRKIDAYIKSKKKTPLTAEIQCATKNGEKFFTELSLEEIEGPFTMLHSSHSLGSSIAGKDRPKGSQLFAVVLHHWQREIFELFPI